jgi:hypothetical protein
MTHLQINRRRYEMNTVAMPGFTAERRASGAGFK